MISLQKKGKILYGLTVPAQMNLDRKGPENGTIWDT